LKVHKGIAKWTAHLKNSSFKFGVDVEPTDFNTDEKSLEIDLSGKYRPNHEEIIGNAGLKFGSPKLGPLRLWLEVSLFVYLTNDMIP
jgi:hypothetical protein